MRQTGSDLSGLEATKNPGPRELKGGGAYGVLQPALPSCDNCTLAAAGACCRWRAAPLLTVTMEWVPADMRGERGLDPQGGDRRDTYDHESK